MSLFVIGVFAEPSLSSVASFFASPHTGLPTGIPSRRKIVDTVGVQTNEVSCTGAAACRGPRSKFSDRRYDSTSPADVTRGRIRPWVTSSRYLPSAKRIITRPNPAHSLVLSFSRATDSRS